VPFGGMRIPSSSSSTNATLYSCDLVGCKVVKHR
jgi:hypothetical protein